jgi:hypothetical protein
MFLKPSPVSPNLPSTMSLLKTALLLASIVAFVATNPIHESALSNLPAAHEPWAQKTCSGPGQINNAEASAAARWEAADAKDAWNAVMLAWNQEPVPAGDNSLNFSAYVGNFFQAKSGLACENMADNPCDDTIACTDVDKPAGYAPSILKFRYSEADDKMIRRYLIINSMVTLHSVCSHHTFDTHC